MAQDTERAGLNLASIERTLAQDLDALSAGRSTDARRSIDFHIGALMGEITCLRAEVARLLDDAGVSR